MTRSVFDANVLASGIVGIVLRSPAAPATLLRRWRRGEFSLVVSERILEEVEFSAFSRPYFQQVLSESTRHRSIAMVRRNAELVALTQEVVGIAPDPNDDHVLAAALSSGATYIVTGDRRLRSVDMYAGVRLVTPQEFLQILAGDARLD